MSVDLCFQCAPCNGAAKRLVSVLRDGSEVFRDKVDCDSHAARRRFFNELAELVGEPAEDLAKRYDAELRQKASEADRQADEAARQDKADATDTFEIARRELEGTPQAIRVEAARMARNPELLREVYADLATLGLAGEAELALTCFLVGISRLLPDPLAAVVIGATSSGKSYLLRLVADLFPPEAVLRITQASPEAWFYLPAGSLRHRFVVLGERPQGETPDVIDANRAWRELVSEGRLIKAVAVRGADGQMATQVVVQEGPVAFCESTTKARLLDEDASRMLLLNSDDSKEQTAKVLAKMFAAAGVTSHASVDAILAKHHAYQRMLATKPPSVSIPFGPRLAERFPTERPECRRIARHGIAMIRASALAHRFQRTTDGETIVAEPADYAVAYRLLQGPAARLLGREPHGSVKRLAAQLRERFGESEFTAVQAAEVGGVSRRWATQGLRWLAENGHAEQTNPGGGPKPATWRLTEALREAGVLPTPEQVFE